MFSGGIGTCAYLLYLQLEIMHAVLNQLELSRDKSFFYFRAPVSSSDDPAQLKVTDGFVRPCKLVPVLLFRWFVLLCVYCLALT